MMKLVTDDRIRQYELTFLIPINFTSTEVSKLLEQIEAMCKKHSAEVISKTEWGEMPLAYAIRYKSKPLNSAVYYHWVIQAPAKQIAPLDRSLRLTPEVIRFLLVVIDAVTPSPVVKKK